MENNLKKETKFFFVCKCLLIAAVLVLYAMQAAILIPVGGILYSWQMAAIFSSSSFVYSVPYSVGWEM